ncbi:MAG: capsular biosynthesis protein [Muribaculaceae bacterium]|nr:capsular biosynthesis protein [Muribaculaceae bacterium]
MWPFKKHVDTLQASGILNGMTDWHSHILPGVDDGFRDMESSLEVLRLYDELGIRKVWLTPHIMEDYPNTTDFLRGRFSELQEKWDGHVQLALASENMLDSLFEERLSKNDLLPIGDRGDHLLVETSYFNPPMGMDDIIDNIFQAGYFPLLAHPERYRYMGDDDYRKLRDKGVKFQINYCSLAGQYGDTARKRAEWLLKNGMAEVTGSDVHRLDTLSMFIDKSPSKKEFSDRLAPLMQVRDLAML